MTTKYLDSFLATVDPNKATVVSFPDYIAVFGGPIAKNKKQKVIKSQRDAFVRWVSQNRSELDATLLLPESYDDWNDFNTYSDLLLFEKDLGCLTCAVVIFVEAPGAIAELGAFSQIPLLSQRLLVVVTESRHPKKSFISLGPIRSVFETQNHAHSVCVIPDGKPADLIAHMPAVMGTLDQKRQPKSSSATFNKTESQHQILLILDLINLLLVTTSSELQRIAGHFGVNLDRSRLNQILFTLEKTQFITRKMYGSTTYFVPNKFKKTYIDFRSIAGAIAFSRERSKTERWNEIQSDPFRKNAYALANKGGV